MFNKGDVVTYIGETNGAYKKGKNYEIVGYDKELNLYGVMSDLEEAYCVAEEFLKKSDAKIYKTLNDLAKDYPEKSAREAQLKKMSNAQINILIDNTHNIQGKIYLESFKEQEI